jgi:hypothetical protein
MAYCDSAVVPGSVRQNLEHQWTFVGEVNGMRAYCRPREAACLVDWDDGLRVFAGVESRKALAELAAELEITRDGLAEM